jgi:murein DD-endopeptidase MepM/ murein hydrolase activator NlpD
MRPPLVMMRIRQNSTKNIFGMVRNAGHRAHQGWDLEAKVGTPIYAVTDGIIRDVKNAGDYGHQLLLEFIFKGQTYYAFYAHLSGTLRRNGEQVCEGDLLGFTGNTGNASNLPRTQDHLHFEVRSLRQPGKGLGGRLDPGLLLGFGIYSCQ